MNIPSATRKPSAADEVIPPAYPAPSPQGNMPLMPTDCKLSSRSILTGELVRLSTPVKRASAHAKPCKRLSITKSALFKEFVIAPPSTSRKSANAVPAAYVGLTSPKPTLTLYCKNPRQAARARNSFCHLLETPRVPIYVGMRSPLRGGRCRNLARLLARSRHCLH